MVNTERYSIINDYLGTPKEAYDSKGKKVWECELTAYGTVKNCTDSSFLPFRFQGQYHDEETGLYYNRFRYYSPEEGMYVTAQDPIRLKGGGKFYSYVDDTNSWIDVFGLECGKAIKNAQSYEKQIQEMYGEKLSQSQRGYSSIVGGKQVNGIADHVAIINGKNIAIDAKYVKDWSKSLRNPESKISSKSFAVKEQQKMLSQAQKYSAAIDEVPYHTNSPQLASHYTKVFQDAGLNNVEIKITP